MSRITAFLLSLACAVAVSLPATAVAALPPTNAGAFDPGFGPNGSGRIVHDYADNYDYATQVIIQPDGKYLVSGRGYSNSGQHSLGFVARYLPEGSLDTGFFGSGRRVIGGPGADTSLMRAVLQPDGKIVLVGQEYFQASGASRGWITRLNADGSTDTGFGTGGVARMMPPSLLRLSFWSVALRPDGSLVAAGIEFDKDYTDIRPFTLRYSPDGRPDPSYGNGGIATFDMLAPGFRPQRLAVHASGKMTMAGYAQMTTFDAGAYKAVAVRLNANGSPDASFGTGGKYTYALAGLGTEFDDMVADADGTVLLAGGVFGDARAGIVARILSSGQPDPAFGAQGVLTLPQGMTYAGAITRQADGKFVIGATKAVGNDFQAQVARLLPGGQLDATFGVGGISQDFGFATSQVLALAIDVDGKIVLAGKAENDSNDNSLVARLIGAEITTRVIEFYNAALNHYFITADPAEAAAIDGGAAGPGWSRTGETFRSGGPNRVCRFYGSPETDAVTGARRGPNSHFYTIEAAECAAVKEDAGWRFESHDFNGWPSAGGNCAAGTVAVKRAYNNRFAVNDSNHRYTINDAVYGQMLASGWTGEGTVFCAVQ